MVCGRSTLCGSAWIRRLGGVLTRGVSLASGFFSSSWSLVDSGALEIASLSGHGEPHGLRRGEFWGHCLGESQDTWWRPTALAQQTRSEKGLKGPGKLGIPEWEVAAGLCWRVVTPQRHLEFVSIRQAPIARRPLDVLLAARQGLGSFPGRGPRREETGSPQGHGEKGKHLCPSQKPGVALPALVLSSTLRSHRCARLRT